MIESSVSPQSVSRVASPTPVSATTTLLKYVPSNSPPATIIDSRTGPSSSGSPPSILVLLSLPPPSPNGKLPPSTPPSDTPPSPFPRYSRSHADTLSSGPSPSLHPAPASFPRLSLVASPITSIIPTHFLLGNFPTRLEDEYASKWAPTR
ncbi:hypothetical protein C8R45DRAFT_1090856 [Mycena sanguinolenta]|nr:hypothetical protein C8R45DRAFT_1090856 [Mycena sanguinolenta]